MNRPGGNDTATIGTVGAEGQAEAMAIINE